MSILIKGMEMPKFYDDCPFNYNGLCTMCNNQVCLLNVERGEPPYDACPIVPVQPHGRMIDADAYESLLRGLGDRNYRREKGTICDAVKFLHPHYAPTIIQAEEGET